MLLLVHDPSDEPAGESPRQRRRLPTLPWRPFAWVAAFCWLLVIAEALGGLPGYLVVLAAVALACWRLDRWMARWDLGGMRNYTRGY